MEELLLAIFESEDNNIIDMGTRNEMISILESSYDIYEEGFKDGVKKVTDTACKSVKPVNDTFNKGTEWIAKKVVKKPSEDSDKSVYEEYKKKIDKIKAGIKITAIGAGNAAVFAIPIPGSSTVFNAVIASALASSDDSSDKMVKDSLKSLKEKAVKLKEHVTKFFKKNSNKEFKSENEIKKEFNALDAEASLLAKKVDSFHNGKAAKVVAESVTINASFFEKCLPDLSKEIPLEFYETTVSYINNMDASNANDVLIAEAFLNVIIKDSKL